MMEEAVPRSAEGRVESAAVARLRGRERDDASYEDVRSEIMLGDLLLFQGKAPLSWLIRHLTHGSYSHAGLAVWWDHPAGRRLMVFEAVLEGVAVRPASTAVDRYPGQVDWWALRPEYRQQLKCDLLFRRALDLLGSRYSVGGLFAFAGRLLAHKTDFVPDRRSASYFCSQYVCACFRNAGLDLVEEKPDHLTSPEDLARSGCFEYRKTLHRAGH